MTGTISGNGIREFTNMFRSARQLPNNMSIARSEVGSNVTNSIWTSSQTSVMIGGICASHVIQDSFRASPLVLDLDGDGGLSIY